MNRRRTSPGLAMAILLCAAAGGFFPLAAQEAPADAPPALTLPDLTEEVRRLENRELAVPAPDLPPLDLPAAEPPLPEEAELAIPASAYETEAVLDTRARPALGETFSEVSAGAGLWDGVSANLSVYRPGADPAFSMAFAHESRDGFAFQEAGAGYAFRRTDLGGRVRGGTAGSGLWAVSGSFSDQADGLQGNSLDFYGVAHRYLQLEATYRRPLGPLGLATELRVGSAALSLERGQAYTAGDTGMEEAALDPALSLDWTVRGLELELRTSWSFRGLLGDPEAVALADRRASRGSVGLAASYDYSPAVSFGAAAAAALDENLVFSFPFSLWTTAGLGTRAAVRLEGGLASDNPSLADAWRENPYLDVGGVAKNDERWFAAGSLDLYPRDGLILSVGADWADSLGDGGRLVPGALDPDRALFAYSFEAYRTLAGTVALRRRFGSTELRLSWRSDWLDAPVYGAPQTLSAGIEYRDQRERYGLELAGSAGFDPEGFEFPRLDIHAFLRLGSGARLLAEILDIAAATQGDDGREFLGPYRDQGFQAGLRLQFSL